MHVTLPSRFWTKRSLGLEFGKNWCQNYNPKWPFFKKSVYLPAFLHNFHTFTITYFSDPKIKISWEKFGSSRFVEFLPRTFHAPLRPFTMEKIPEDVRRLPKTFEGDPKMFPWYTNEFKYNLRDKRDITEIIDIFTCEDIVRISYRFYQFVTTRYTTGFYIIIYDYKIKLA